MTVSDDQTTPEAKAALEAARAVVPTFPIPFEECDHHSEEKVGHGTYEDTGEYDLIRCTGCGYERTVPA